MDVDTQDFVYLPKAARTQGLYIIGIQGTGKSGLIENLIMQDIDQQIGVCVLDPHGELVDHVIARLDTKDVDKVIVLDLANYDYPFGLNIFTCSDLTNPLEVQKTVDQVLHVFEKLLGVSQDTPLILEYLYNCTYTLLVNPGYTMADIPLLLQDEHCRKKLVAQVTDPDVSLFWMLHDRKRPSDQLNDIASTMRRVKQFLQPLSRPIVGQAYTTIDLQKIMHDGKILLVKLSAQVDSVSSLIGSLMIALLLNAAYARPAQRKQFHVYADEFQRFATEDFATLLEEARKFAIGTTIAHQNRSQLNSANGKLETDLKDRSRSVGNMVVFKINSKDAEDLAGQFDTTPPPALEEDIEIIDGTEPIMTPVTDVVGHLLKNEHRSDIINQFSHGTLRKMLQNVRYPEHLEPINDLLYEGMVGLPSPEFIPENKRVIAHTYLLNIIAAIGGNWYYVVLKKTEKWDKITHDDTVAAEAMRQIWREPEGSSLYQKAVQILDREVKNVIRNDELQKLEAWDLKLIEKLRNGTAENPDKPYVEHHASQFIGSRYFPEMAYTSYETYPASLWKTLLRQGIEILNGTVRVRIPTGKWYPIDFIDFLTWELGSQKDKLTPGQEYTIANMYAYQLEQEVETILQPEKAQFLAFICELKLVCQELSKPENQIKAPSGLEQPHKRTQHIVHAQQSHADKEKEIANQLSGLPNFTARVKIGMSVSQNPGKNCLICGFQNRSVAAYCGMCGTKITGRDEYTITTVKPSSGINAQHLAQRKKQIQANNIRDGILRNRADVEAEITQRQTGSSGGSAPAQLQQPQQPSPQQTQPRHTRQVPVQGNCPNCGVTNAPGSIFCNQCGTKL